MSQKTFSKQPSYQGLKWLTILLWGGVGVMLLPLGVVFLTSFASPDSVSVSLIPRSFTLANYKQVWKEGNFLLAFANSTLVALGVTGFQLLTSALAGYAFDRLSFKGRSTLLLVILATLVIPFQLLVIPIFLVLKWGHLINTYWALILPTAVSGYSIFLMRQFFSTIPKELEEAGQLDGATPWQVLVYIMLPLSRPALITVFLLSFIGEWNDLFKPLVFTTRPELRTVQLVLAEFQEQFTSNWQVLMAGVVVATLPVVLLFLIGQRQFIRGIGTTGIKS